MKIFEDDNDGYFRWLETHRDGYVVNVDRPGRVPQYPMVHRASHGVISSSKIGNFTTGSYVKWCGMDLEELEAYSMASHGRKLTHCRLCM